VLRLKSFQLYKIKQYINSQHEKDTLSSIKYWDAGKKWEKGNSRMPQGNKIIIIVSSAGWLVVSFCLLLAGVETIIHNRGK